MKAALATKKVFITAGVIIAGMMMLTLPSCKHEDCGAYQGSGKGTRSFKKSKHHHAMVISFDHTRKA